MSSGRGQLGQIADPALRAQIMFLQDQVRELATQLAALQASTLQAGTGNDAGAMLAGSKRIAQVADPVQDQDVMTLNAFQRLTQGGQVLLTRVGHLISGIVPARLVRAGTFGGAEVPGATENYAFPAAVDAAGAMRSTNFLGFTLLTGSAVEMIYDPGLVRGFIRALTRPALTVLDLRIDGIPLVLNAGGGGNVGVGNAAPARKLDVTGTLRATGNVDFDADLDVDGNSNFDGTVNIEGATVVDDNLTVTGTLAALGDATVSGTADVGTLKTGSVVALGGEVLTSYLTIQDSAGNPVKLAVVV